MQNSYTDNLRRILTEATDFSVVCEIYSSDAVPSANGFDPNTAIKRYSSTNDLQSAVGSFFGANYTRLVRSFGSIRRTITAEVNSASVDFDNLSREISTFELAGVGFEGLVKVIRLISRSQSVLLSDSLILFVGRCDKPKSGNRVKMSVSSKHILGSTDTEIPRRKYSPEDAEGRHPADKLFEGFRFAPQYGVATYSTREKRGGLLGFLGFKKTVTHTLAYSSYSDLDASKFVPEGFGRVQVIGTHLGYVDIGVFIRMTTAFLDGEVKSFHNLRSVTAPFYLYAANYRYGKNGGVDEQLPYNDPNPALPQPADGYYSRTAFVFSAVQGTTVQSNDPAPDMVSVILAKMLVIPDVAGNWVNYDWSDDGAAQTRFILTSPDYYKLDAAWINDASFLEVFNFNKEIIFDSSYSDTLFVPDNLSFTGANAPAMQPFFRSTAVCSPEYFQFLNKDKSVEAAFLLDPRIVPYSNNIIPIDPGGDGGGGGGGGGGGPTSNLYFFLRRRYVSNVVVTEQLKTIDFLHNVLFPASRIFFSQDAAGRIKLNSKKPVDWALAVNNLAGNTVAADDVSNWISDKSGQLLIDPNTLQSEVRTVTGANYSINQNTVTLDASINIAVTGFSGGNGAGVPATAQLRINSTTPDNFFILDGINVPFTAADGDTIESIAGFIYGSINGHPVLRRKFAASWNPGSSDVFISGKSGSLNLDANLQFNHAAPIANPTLPPVLTASSGTLSAGTYKIAYSYTNERGQTLLSPFAEITLTANQKINVAAVSVPSGASCEWYCSPAANDRKLRFVKKNNGAAFVIDALPRVSAALPSDINRTGTEIMRVAQVFSDRSDPRSNIAKSNVLKATFEWLPERRQPVNQVEVNYRDSTQDWRLSRIILRDDAHIAKTKKTSKLEINGQAIDSYHQAYRIASGLLAENRDADFFYKWTADREALLLEEGSVVCITDDSSGVYNLAVRIEQIEVNVDKGFPKVTFTARKYSTTLYDDSVAERQIPVIIETGSAANIAAEAAMYQYTPTNFTETRTLNLKTASQGDIANALATVMGDLENHRK